MKKQKIPAYVTKALRENLVVLRKKHKLLEVLGPPPPGWRDKNDRSSKRI